MEPLVTFVGGLALLLGVGGMVFRDLPAASQNSIERHLLGWLHRVRSPANQPNQHSQSALTENKPPPSLTTDGTAAENAASPTRRSRSRATARRLDGE